MVFGRPVRTTFRFSLACFALRAFGLDRSLAILLRNLCNRVTAALRAFDPHPVIGRFLAQPLRLQLLLSRAALWQARAIAHFLAEPLRSHCLRALRPEPVGVHGAVVSLARCAPNL